MLSRLLLAFTLLFSLNSFAESHSMRGEELQIILTPEALKIREPFTALATAYLKVENKTPFSIKIKKITSNQARHVDIYQRYINDFGAEQMKRAKNVKIVAEKTTEFKNNEFQIMLTGLKRKYEVGEEVELIIEFEKHGKFTTYLPVHANYK